MIYTSEQIDAINDFYNRVCDLAERKMEMTLRLEGSHYAAMREIIEEINHGQRPDRTMQNPN